MICSGGPVAVPPSFWTESFCLSCGLVQVALCHSDAQWLRRRPFLRGFRAESRYCTVVHCVCGEVSRHYSSLLPLAVAGLS